MRALIRTLLLRAHLIRTETFAAVPAKLFEIAQLVALFVCAERITTSLWNVGFVLATSVVGQRHFWRTKKFDPLALSATIFLLHFLSSDVMFVSGYIP